MLNQPIAPPPPDVLTHAARYGAGFRASTRPLHPTATLAELRALFCQPLDDDGHPGDRVIRELIAAAEGGLVGNTDPGFFGWVMGSSNLVGVAADWLTSAWGQNAALYQASPAAAVAEEAVAAWLLDLLDLPRQSTVGFVTGASEAAFVGLSAARGEVLRRSGHDVHALGLHGAPLVRIYLSDDAHVTNYAALRQLGFGEANFHRMPPDAAGLMRADDLADAMSRHAGPKIVLAQAGHINSGGFEPLARIAEIARTHDAWVHVDGAFGLWARVSASKSALAAGAELADSWSVDGHKWLQLPYDSGFAIVRHPEAHMRAMRKHAGYLNSDSADGRSPCDFVPGLSRRARGFAAWAVLRHLGRAGIASLIDDHCAAAAHLAKQVSGIDGLAVLNRVELNQVVIGCDGGDAAICALAERLNRDSRVFVRTAEWRGRLVLRVSIIAQGAGLAQADMLAAGIASAWRALRPRLSPAPA